MRTLLPHTNEKPAKGSRVAQGVAKSCSLRAGAEGYNGRFRAALVHALGDRVSGPLPRRWIGNFLGGKAVSQDVRPVTGRKAVFVVKHNDLAGLEHHAPNVTES